MGNQSSNQKNILIDDLTSFYNDKIESVKKNQLLREKSLDEQKNQLLKMVSGIKECRKKCVVDYDNADNANIRKPCYATCVVKCDRDEFISIDSIKSDIDYNQSYISDYQKETDEYNKNIDIVKNFDKEMKLCHDNYYTRLTASGRLDKLTKSGLINKYRYVDQDKCVKIIQF